MPENKPFLKVLLTFILLSVFLLPVNSHAQKAYEFTPGYYLTLNNDTVKAGILFNYWIVSPDRIKVKDLETAEVKELRSTEIAGFGIVTKKINADYRSFKQELRYIENPETIIPYGESPFSEISETAFFGRVLILGKQASLFQMVDKYDKERFFLEKNGVITELEKYSYLFRKRNDHRFYMIKDDRYKLQLSNICSDAPQMESITPFYNEKALKDYILKYNHCFTDEVIEVKKREKATIDFVTGAGFADQNLNRFPWSNFHPSGVTKNPMKLYPQLEAGVRVNFVNTFKTIFFEVDCNLLSNVFTRLEQTGTLNRFNFYFGKHLRNTKKINHRFLFGFSESGQGLIIGTGLSRKKTLNLDLRSKLYRFPGGDMSQTWMYRLDFTLQYAL